MIDPAYLNAYLDRLQAHDWHYERSDDNRVWKAGQAARLALEREADLDSTGALRALYHAMLRWRFSALDRIDVELSHREHIDLILRRATGKAPDRATDTQLLARCVRSLAHALARADPDNGSPSRAMKLLQDLQLLESTLLPKPAEKTHAP